MGRGQDRAGEIGSITLFTVYIGLFLVAGTALLIGGLPSDDPAECDGVPMRPGQICVQGSSENGVEAGVGREYSYDDMVEIQRRANEPDGALMGVGATLIVLSLGGAVWFIRSLKR